MKTLEQLKKEMDAADDAADAAWVAAWAATDAYFKALQKEGEK